MRIGIDVSQLAYSNTGVANYLKNLVINLLKTDTQNEYVLFFSSLRQKFPFDDFKSVSHNHLQIKTFKFPPTVLDMLWNRFHTFPIERLIGNVDVFITSDWTEPPCQKAKKMTILYDLIIYKYPQETDSKIVATQKRKLSWVKKESNKILCISEATKNDAQELLGIEENKLEIIHPGI